MNEKFLYDRPALSGRFGVELCVFNVGQVVATTVAVPQ